MKVSSDMTPCWLVNNGADILVELVASTCRVVLRRVDCPWYGGRNVMWNVSNCKPVYNVSYPFSWVFTNTAVRTSNLTQQSGVKELQTVTCVTLSLTMISLLWHNESSKISLWINWCQLIHYTTHMVKAWFRDHVRIPTTKTVLLLNVILWPTIQRCSCAV